MARARASSRTLDDFLFHLEDLLVQGCCLRGSEGEGGHRVRSIKDVPIQELSRVASSCHGYQIDNDSQTGEWEGGKASVFTWNQA